MALIIGEVSKILNIPSSTIRYYEQEGILSFVKRTDNGIRLFEDKDLEVLEFIECLKKTGMSIKNIKKFMNYVSKGDSTISERLDMMKEQRNIVIREIEQLKNMLDMLDYKCWFYETSKEAGTCKIHENDDFENTPRKYRKFLNKDY